ncbi:hypothetical protein [Halorussus litoreus]|uniref:hypothetical protein n=1 Tax=Halorussus litoreus TaxID=1710536 RepID=UPI000E23AEE1|nr:hypothetical protein [Halorussus litoreus]
MAVLALVAAALVGVPGVVDGAEDSPADDRLANQIQEQTDATADAMALTNSPWVPRTAGLGLGLAVGLLGGGLLAYATRGGNE